MSYKEKRMYEQLEKEIAKLEKEQKEIEALLCSGKLNVDELTEKSKRFAVCMMNLMFQLLDNNGDRYVNADVLLVSDFLIPYPDTSYIQRMKSYRKTGTRFYGMRIVPEGTKSTEWEPDFDHIYPITYRQLRRY